MKLPGFDRAVIDRSKLRDYLLSPFHPVGRFKATFFLSLGYSRDDWARLEVELRELIASTDAVPEEQGKYGMKYTVRGTLRGPKDATRDIVTIWIILNGEDFPRFVTAYPGASYEI
jgi:hypothetical protein